ncbi:CubicO group peptidase (beta-lactamase class C family) [Tahibacter aquaticus]|uniref:CubicO group peptidase (Beta-lactamase class C family) n=1 Tax=Tahibacter aquaticus TaxID=520092 RepID=A0A4R6YMP4_9GAMM|nr:CubicO group peptidase (beta-lactamase class C family) [Tahibacter aquaticus]
MPRWLALAMLGTAVTAVQAQAAPPPPIVAQAIPAQSALDALFDQTLQRYQLPGLAVGVVVDGKVVFRRTAGETRAGSRQAITPDTLFKIASNSKAMTTALLARLADAGKLSWTDPVLRHLPGFRMYDPWVTGEIQLRDLLIHNSGLRAGAGDLMLWPEPNAFSRADVMAALAHLKPAYSFRSRYDYDNLLYIVAGEVAAAAGGASYEELLRREVFQPLGLRRCQVGEWRRDAVGNVAQPHMRKDGRNVVIRADGKTIPAVASAAAGGIRCSLDDMLTWTRAWLDVDTKAADGTTPWLSRTQREAVWTAQIPLGLGARQRSWDDAHFSAYGYGWRLSDVDGTLKVSHTGTLAGMYSVLTLLPQKKVGFVVLINGDGGEARTVLNQALVKHYSAPQQAVGIASLAEQLAQERGTDTSAAAEAKPQRTAVGPDEVAQWSGIYRDAWFGDVRLCAAKGKVYFEAAKSPRLSGPVLRQDGRLLVDWDDDSVDAEPWLDFHAGAAGEPDRLTLEHVDKNADFSYDYPDLAFVRVGDCAKSRR